MRGFIQSGLITDRHFRPTIMQRLLALFFCLLFLFSAAIPSLSVYAATKDADNSTTHLNLPSAAETKTKMKKNYPAGAQPTLSDIPAATDSPALNTPTNTLTASGNKNIPNGSLLQKAINQGGRASTQTVTQHDPTAVSNNLAPQVKTKPHELTDKRTATSSVFENANGTMTQKYYVTPHFYQKDSKWEAIDTTLHEDKNAGDSSNIFGKALGQAESWLSSANDYTVTGNDWLARFSPSGSKKGMVRVSEGKDQVGFSPVNANSVNPVITTDKKGKQTVHYYNLWNDIDVEYVVQNAGIKENIILKNKHAASSVSFKLVGSAKLKKQAATKTAAASYLLNGVLGNEFSISPANLVLNTFGMVTTDGDFTQTYSGDTITLSVKSDFYENLSDDAFPAVIDPGVFRSTYGTRYGGGNYISFKSDGYICPWNICNTYAGTLYDSTYTLRDWRSAFFAPYDQFRSSGITLTNATLHLEQLTGVSHWTGTTASHNYQIGHATCLTGYTCIDHTWASATLSSSGNFNVTTLYNSLISGGDFGGWLMVAGDDSTTSSFKEFNPDNDYVDFTYGGTPQAPTISSPSNNQVYIDPQVSFSVNYETNPNGASPLQYQIQVSSAPGGYGTLATSPLLSTTSWTIPDGVLQDGVTYYVRALSYDAPYTHTYSSWGPSVAFRIDKRTGIADKTQTYDTFGPATVDLATGNLYTSSSSHATTALGGNLGVTLNYNSPLKSRAGLVGEYYNFMTDPYTPVATRVDQSISYNWGTSAPAPSVDPTNFLVEWNGYFIPPTTGTYYFGLKNTDMSDVYVDGTFIINSTGSCSTAPCYNNGVYLEAGHAVPILVEFMNLNSSTVASEALYVKGAVSERVVPSNWLQTGVRPSTDQLGLTGSYFGKFDGTNTFSSNNTLLMKRNDPYLNFNWGTTSPMPGGPSGYLIRWTGYVTVPISGNYIFGSNADDGTKIMLGASSTVVMNDWATHTAADRWGSSYAMTANTPTKITIEYYNDSSTGSFLFEVKGAVTQQVVPSSWLSPTANILPAGWTLGADPDGSASYDHIVVNQSSVVLSDATGATHEYTWNDTKKAYIPPVNEDGQLVRNADGTYTLQDIDGRTYIFGVDGTLTSLTSSADDLHPTTLQYEYASTSGGPSHLYKIKDGVDSSRNMILYYSGDTHCAAPPTGFDSTAPAGMLCAVISNDGRTTNFFYTSGQLARINRPGDDDTDYLYQAIAHSTDIAGYLLTGIRSDLANDAIAAGYASDDGTALTNISYDYLGRVSSVVQPAAANGPGISLEYLPGADGYVDSGGSYVPGYAGAANEHIVNAPTEPSGFSRQVRYDKLYRTVESIDANNQATINQWDPTKDILLTSTAPDGRQTSYIYDDEDRLSDTWGPAPASWFASNRLPANSTYADEMAHSQQGYDSGIVGPAVAWYDYSKQTGNTYGVLSGAPKQHTTGIDTSTPGALSYNFTSPPISAGSGMQGIGLSATGKLRLPTGTYTFSAITPDGVRLWVDDQLVLNQWTDSATARTTTSSAFTISSTSPKRFRLDLYRKTGTTGSFSLSVQQSGGFSATTNWASYLSPDYSLTTSATADDSTYGDTTTTVSYGNNPELGAPQSTTIDPAGLALTSSATYEAKNASGSLLRKLSTTLPGGNATIYTHYGATETADDPCTAGTTEAYKQGGMLKQITEPDPDGPGSQTPLTISYVYDDAGRVVATRKNTDSWTCITYDGRGRITQENIPANFYGTSSRNVEYFYAVSGDPLRTMEVDANDGTIETDVDLLGRTTQYVDNLGDTTTYTYDYRGNPYEKNGVAGDEVYAYDDIGRLSTVSLDGTTYATVTYDTYGRLEHVDYNNAGSMALNVGYDTFGTSTSLAYTLGDGTTMLTNTLERSQSGKIEQSEVQSGSTTLDSDYGYDHAGRLTTATIGTNTYSYGFGSQDAYCNNSSNDENISSGKNSNRTSQTINGVSTVFCYNNADQLVDSDNTLYEPAFYDAHGNMTYIGTNTGKPLHITYDSSDRPVTMGSYGGYGNGAETDFAYDATNRMYYRQTFDMASWSNTNYQYYFYGYADASSAPAVLRDSSWNILEKYLSLPGGVVLTIRPQESDPNDKAYTLSDLRANTLFTTDGNGDSTSTGSGPNGSYIYDPFGNPLPSESLAQSKGKSASGFAGQLGKITEDSLDQNPILLGARVYLPSVGRFFTPDPVLGGNTNPYIYPQDPINSNDFSGLSCMLQCTVSVYAIQAAVTAPAYNANATTARIHVAVSVSVVRRTGTVPKAPSAISLDAIDFSSFRSESAIPSANAPSTPQTTQVSTSACLRLCIEASLSYDGHGLPHFSIGYGVGWEIGVSGSVGGGYGIVDTGWNSQFSCSAGPLTATVSPAGNSGGVNFAWAQFGCNAGRSYTF